MKVCFFGSYVRESWGIPSGHGGILLKKILKMQNVEVVECHEEIKSIFSFITAYFKLFFKHKNLKYDIMLIPWRGILTLPLAKLIHKKPIISFPAFSIYDTLVTDRKKIKKNSLKARFAHFVDKLACKWSDLIFLESSEEIRYFVNEFNLHKKKFMQYPMAADESVFQPQKNDDVLKKDFKILYFGSFIPLHGLETIVQASNILKDNNDIIFKICGDGQTRSDIEQQIDRNNCNIKLLGKLSKEELLNNIKESDVCLGIFGNTIKARTVVTNKVFQILASKKPLITMESPAVLEANLENKKNCILVPPSNPKKLVEAILFLKNDLRKCQDIAVEGYNTYVNYLSMDVAGKKIVDSFQELLRKKV